MRKSEGHSGKILLLSAVLGTISLIWILLAASVEFCSYDEGFFRNFQEEHKIHQQMGIEEEQLKRITKDLIEYLKTGENELLERHFHSREIAHMVDVYDLYERGRTLRWGAIIVFAAILLYVLAKKEMPVFFEQMSKILFVTWGIFFLLALVIALNFSRAFVIFHEILFDNDLWLMNPETDRMIQMLPLPFFISIARRILVFFFVAMLALHGLVIYLRKLLRGKTN